MTAWDWPASVGQRSSTVRFDVLDRWRNKMDTIVPLDCSGITASTANSIPRTLDGFTVRSSQLADINLASDLIRPWWVDGSGAEASLGVYCFTDPQTHLWSRDSIVTVPMFDLSHRLDVESERTFGCAPGAAVFQIVDEVLSTLGFDPRSVDVIATDQPALDPIAHQTGTKLLAILEECCRLAGVLPPYFDSNGNLIIRAAPDLTQASADRAYNSVDGRVIADSVHERDGYLEAPNVFQVISSGPTSIEIKGTAEVDADLPFSVENRGYRRPKTIRMQSITSSAHAEQIAQQQASTATQGFKNVTFDSFPDPTHDLYMVVSWEGLRYRETGFHLNFRNGVMSHTLTQGGFGHAG